MSGTTTYNEPQARVRLVGVLDRSSPLDGARGEGRWRYLFRD